MIPLHHILTTDLSEAKTGGEALEGMITENQIYAIEHLLNTSAISYEEKEYIGQWLFELNESEAETVIEKLTETQIPDHPRYSGTSPRPGASYPGPMDKAIEESVNHETR